MGVDRTTVAEDGGQTEILVPNIGFTKDKSEIHCLQKYSLLKSNERISIKNLQYWLQNG